MNPAATRPEPAPAAPAPRRHRVMVVDDSAVIRGFVRRALEADPAIEVVASIGDGRGAVESLRRTDPDVVLLDIEMPEMDGMTALPRLLEVDPTVQVVMVSTLTMASAETSLRALARGATDYIPKPPAGVPGAAEGFARELAEKVTALARARRALLDGPAPALPAPAAFAPAAPPRESVVLRPPPAAAPAVLAIGSSTGGPQALLRLIQGLGRDFMLPVLVVQHMPATFTGILAEHIAKSAGRPAREAAHGLPVQPGQVYIAPGDRHMTVEAGPSGPVIALDRTPPVNFCRPAVDPMLRSAARLYGSGLLVLILTGMGRDGLDGSRAAVEAGGSVIAQDEASSVVWGMPGAVAVAGLCSAVLPLDHIAAHVRGLAGGAGR